MAILLGIMLTGMLAGCDKSGDENTDDIQDVDNVENNENGVGEISEKEQVERYYTYLNEYISGDKTADSLANLVPLEPYETSLYDDKKDRYGFDVFKSDHVGLLSAFLEDFDNDGSLEMLAVFLRYSYTIDTVYRDVFFEPGALFNDENTEYCCMELTCRAYDMNEDGEIENVCSYPYALISTDSFGRILVGIEKVEDEYFIFGYSDSENLSSYGPRHFVVGNLTTGISGKSIQWQYSSTFEYGRAHAGNYNELFHIYSPIKINDTTLATLKFNPEPDLGTRLVTMVDFEFVQGKKKVGTSWVGSDKLIMTPIDNTNLRTHLESGGKTWKRVELPQGGKIEVPKDDGAEKRFNEIIEEISNATGTTFKSTNVTDENGKFKCTYVSEQGNKIFLTWDKEKDCLSGVEVSGSRGAEWVAAKDVLVGLPELGLEAENVAIFSGEVKSREDWLTYTNGIEIGEWKVSLFSVMEDTFRAYK